MQESVSTALNNNSIPSYLTKTRLIPLSKNKGLAQGAFDDIRPIAVRSHISKIMEKAILNRLQLDDNKHILATKNYQAGFKAAQSTAQNISFVAQCLHGNRKWVSKFILLVDIKKAFDSVDRKLLFSILRKRCKTQEQYHLVSLVESLYAENVLIIGDQEIRTSAGVPQGGILSPLLFNIYLEEALMSNPILSQCILSDRLRAYADDLVITFDSKENLKAAVEAIEALGSWNLKLNKSKSIILTRENINNINGIQCATNAKYLGVKLSTDSSLQDK
jgi:retron-type reverse transcriptase